MFCTWFMKIKVLPILNSCYGESYEFNPTAPCIRFSYSYIFFEDFPWRLFEDFSDFVFGCLHKGTLRAGRLFFQNISLSCFLDILVEFGDAIYETKFAILLFYVTTSFDLLWTEWYMSLYSSQLHSTLPYFTLQIPPLLQQNWH